MLSIYLLIPLSLMLFVVAIWAVRYAVKSDQFEDLDNASQRIILDDRQERRQVMQAQAHPDDDTVKTPTAHTSPMTTSTINSTTNLAANKPTDDSDSIL